MEPAEKKAGSIQEGASIVSNIFRFGKMPRMFRTHDSSTFQCILTSTGLNSTLHILRIRSPEEKFIINWPRVC